MKKITLSSIIASSIVLPSLALAASSTGSSTGYSIPGIPNQTGNADVTSITTTILNKVWVVFAAIAIILFVWAGVRFLTAGGAAEKIQEARTAAMWGVVGIVVMILAFSIFTIAASLISA